MNGLVGQQSWIFEIRLLMKKMYKLSIQNKTQYIHKDRCKFSYEQQARFLPVTRNISQMYVIDLIFKILHKCGISLGPNLQILLLCYASPCFKTTCMLWYCCSAWCALTILNTIQGKMVSLNCECPCTRKIF